MTDDGKCRFCNHSDVGRKKGDLIRCKRFSQFVDPQSKCDKYCDLSPQALAVMREKFRLAGIKLEE